MRNPTNGTITAMADYENKTGTIIPAYVFVEAGKEAAIRDKCVVACLKVGMVLCDGEKPAPPQEEERSESGVDVLAHPEVKSTKKRRVQ
jgi:hypothetical protein